MNLIKGLLPSEYKDRAHAIVGISLSLALGIIMGLIFRISFLSADNLEPPTIKEDRFLLLSKGFETVKYRIQRNDTLFDILHRLGTPLMNISDLIQIIKKLYPVRNLKPGSEIKIQINRNNGTVQRLECPLDQDTLLVVNNSPQGLTAYKQEIEFETRLSLIAGKIKTSFFEDSIQAGLNPQLVLDLADIFGWDIDFFVDVREGDSFRVLLKDNYKEGKFVYTKRILAAEFVNQGRTYQVFYFKNNNGIEGYYDSAGRSVRKQFLKSPLRYSRISSSFTTRRLHPILKIYRPHYGIDYAAPPGTPIEAVCDGKVMFAGWKGGYGNCITIQHNATYASNYGHLSHFAQGIKAGAKVKQGEIIGFVGSTGLATGPHLDYRISEHGDFINPFNLKNSNTEGLNSRYRGRFEEIKREMLARLDGPKRRGILLAKNSSLF
ncbi:MAG TPA: peptidoglycan DD-metalloendopeptidase family protein [Thermodesulfobacteriota bacterium]|nr:peptidoglycan DD-metalloendopeptidase family protein [Thermodesulfobacteriota bacterium]